MRVSYSRGKRETSEFVLSLVTSACMIRDFAFFFCFSSCHQCSVPGCIQKAFPWCFGNGFILVRWFDTRLVDRSSFGILLYTLW